MQMPSAFQVYYTGDKPVEALPAIVKTAALYFSALRGVKGVQCYARLMIMATDLHEVLTLNSHVGVRFVFFWPKLSREVPSVQCFVRRKQLCVSAAKAPLCLWLAPDKNHQARHTLSKTS